MTGLLENLITLGYLGVFVFSLVVNLIPFFGPSNLFIAGSVGSLFPSFNPILIGFLIAVGASIAKTIHFGVSFFASNLIRSRQKIETGKNGERKPISRRFGMVALFVAAASPIPDDPIVIPLGLMRYNPIKFFVAYFAGKAIITVVGAYFGQAFGLTLEEYLGQTATIIISVILTILVTIALIKKEIILKKLKWHQLPKGNGAAPW